MKFVILAMSLLIVFTTFFASPLPSSREVFAATCPTTLVGYWKFDDGSGSTPDDSSGNGNHSNRNGPSWTTGQVGGALGFDGSNDTVTINSSAPLNTMNGKASVSVWVRPTAFDSVWRRIITRAEYPNQQFYMESVGDGSGRIAVGIGPVSLTSAAALNTNTWYNLTMTYDGSVLKFYINGVLDKQQSGSGAIPTGGNISIGSDMSANEVWSGRIDEVALWNTALSPEQVAVAYSGGVDTSCTAPTSTPTPTSVPSAQVNFGLNPKGPVCSNPDFEVNAGSTTAINLGVCTPVIPTPTVVWQDPIVPTVTPGDGGGGGGDTTDPTVTITTPTTAPTYTTPSDTVNIGGNATDNVDVKEVTWTNSGGNSGPANGTDNWTATVPLVNGDNTITVTAHDNAGNTSTDVITVTTTAGAGDTTSPTVTITNPTSSPTYSTPTTNVNLGGSADDNVEVAFVTWTNPATGDSGTANGTDNWTATVPLVNGSNTITVTAHDVAGNTSSDIITVTSTGGGGPVVCGSTGGASGGSIDYSAPTSVCSVTTCTVPAQVSNPAGSTSYTVDVIVNPNNTLDGHVYEDTLNNGCTTLTPYNGARVTISNGSGSSPFGSTNSSGAYSVVDNATCTLDRTATVSNVSGYHVRGVRYDSSGAFSSTDPKLTGNDYFMNFATANHHTLDWCVSNISPWIIIGDPPIDGTGVGTGIGGDVRRGSLNNNVPNSLAASVGVPPALFISSKGTASFGNGSSGGWVISREYDSNSDPRSRNGVFSYTFFKNRAKTQGITVKNLATTAGVSCTGGDCIISNLPTGIYEYTGPGGNLTITAYTHPLTNSHVTILAQGNITIKVGAGADKMKVPVGGGNLLVIAAGMKADGTGGNVNIDKEVGVPYNDNSGIAIAGILTAEKSINILSKDNACQTGIEDNKLSFAGNFITNSLKPFATSGVGTLVNDRSLCSHDSVSPSLTVTFRPDFIPQLTDFYKIPITRWRELNP